MKACQENLQTEIIHLHRLSPSEVSCVFFFKYGKGKRLLYIPNGQQTMCSCYLWYGRGDFKLIVLLFDATDA